MKMVIAERNSYHDFYIAERVIVIEDFGNGFYWVESENGLREAIVRESDVRGYDAIDEYEDMYCEVCGGTACIC